MWTFSLYLALADLFPDIIPLVFILGMIQCRSPIPLPLLDTASDADDIDSLLKV